MNFKTKLWLPFLMTLAFYGFMGSVYSDMLPTDQTWQASHPELQWGMALANFRAFKKTKATYSVNPMEARPLDYLLMDFHEVHKNDPFRQPFFSAQTSPGDTMTYVFYRGKLCMTAEPILLFEIEDVQNSLKAKYPLLASTEQDTPYDISDSNGPIKTTFFYDIYAETASTLICLVQVNGYYEDDVFSSVGNDLLALTKGDLRAAYLVHLPKNYLTGGNAYKDWLFIRKNLRVWANSQDKLKCAIEN
jgi:hypothetical protein